MEVRAIHWTSGSLNPTRYIALKCGVTLVVVFSCHLEVSLVRTSRLIGLIINGTSGERTMTPVRAARVLALINGSLVASSEFASWVMMSVD